MSPLSSKKMVNGKLQMANGELLPIKPVPHGKLRTGFERNRKNHHRQPQEHPKTVYTDAAGTLPFIIHPHHFLDKRG